LLRYSLAATVLLLSPTLFDLWRHTRGDQQPSPTRLLLALFNSASAFFLVSFQVHEKSYLLPLAPLAFLVLDDPIFVGWVSVTAAFR